MVIRIEIIIVELPQQLPFAFLYLGLGVLRQ